MFIREAEREQDAAGVWEGQRETTKREAMTRSSKDVLETSSRSSNHPASEEGEEERNSKAQVERAGKHAADRKDGGVMERRVVVEAHRSNTRHLQQHSRGG